jgi:hypothetical protein
LQSLHFFIHQLRSFVRYARLIRVRVSFPQYSSLRYPLQSIQSSNCDTLATSITMKLSYILLLSVSATMQVIASEIANPDTQSASGVAAKEVISVGKQYMLDSEGLIRSSHVHTLNSPPGENADIEARAAKDKAKGKQGTKPAKGTPATAQPAKGNPAKGTPAKPTPAKPTPAKPTPAKPTPTPKNPPKGKTGKCMRQVTMKSSSGKGKPAKAKPGKGKVVKRTYIDFLKSRDAQATPMTFQTIAVRT